MTAGRLNTKLEALSRIIDESMGLHYPASRLADLERGVRAVAQSRGFDDIEACIAWLLASPMADRLDILAKHLTIGETYFFRHPETFQALERTILPPLIASRANGDRRLRIWCAACSSGEEPYSVALMLRRLIPDLSNWQITVLATDINRDVLARAIEGRYGEWSFRGSAEAYRQTAFETTSPGRYLLQPEVRQMVRFAYLNLAEIPFSSVAADSAPFDIVFCRNVMIYFTEGHIRRLLGEFARIITPGGWLVTSPVETTYGTASLFSAAMVDGAMLLRNDGGKSAASRPSGAPAAIRPLGPMPAERQASADVPSKRQGIQHTRTAPVANDSIAPRSGIQRLPTPSYATNSHSSKIAGSGVAEALRLYEQGHTVAALDVLKASCRSNDPDAAALSARIYADLGNMREAQDWCEKALAIDCVRPELQYLLASIHLTNNRADEAAAALRRALYLDSRFVMAHYTLGLLARSAGRLPEAERQLQLVLRLLESQADDEIVPESEGLSVGRMRVMTESVLQSKK